MDPYKITFQSWDQVASLYQDYFMDLDLYNDTYDIFIGMLEKPGASIFEIGCGPGNITRYLLSQRPDFRIEAIDVAPNMVRLAEINNPAASFRVMDCREIDRITARYDAVLCGFVLPYLDREACAKLIRDSAALLNSGGLLYASVIEGDYGQSGFETSSRGTDEMFVYYYREADLLEALEDGGFEPVVLERKHYTRKDGTDNTHLILIARKKYTV
jgi:2-polyprenyl-3-methyl-5-hydroxy-6-metoxy-1,4-benzoquinol methylase